MIWYLLLILLILFLVWLLLGPVVLLIDTDHNRYHLALPGIFKVAVVPTEELFHIRGWIFFWPFKFYPFRRRKRKPGKTARTPVKKRRFIKSPVGIGTAMEAIRTIRIRRLELDLDTDDFILNAWLVPAFSLLNGGNTRLRVNFEGTSSLLLDLRFRLGALLWVLIRNRTKTFF